MFGVVMSNIGERKAVSPHEEKSRKSFHGCLYMVDGTSNRLRAGWMILSLLRLLVAFATRKYKM
jgi:hypothetical protein